MSALSVTLGADITGLVHAMGKASHVVGDTARKMHKATGSGFAGIGKAGGAALMGGLGLVGAGITATIGAALAGGAAAMGVGVKSVMSAANFEQTKVAFTTLIGDAAVAEKTLADLRQLGADTPFEFPELADAGRKLIAFGEGADTVTGTLRRIGDVSAGIQAPIGEIAEIYGKARVQGRLFAEDINQLTGRGIPILGQLAKQFGVGEGEVRKLVESGKVGFPEIEKAFVAMTSKGGQFFGMMEAQSKTTKGLWSTLMDGFNAVFLAIGEPINDAIRPLIAQAIEMVDKLTPMAVEAGNSVKYAINFMLAAFKSGLVTSLVATSLQYGFELAINSLINGLRLAVTFFFTMIANGSMWMGLGAVLVGVAEIFGGAMMNAFRYPMEIFQARMLSWFARSKNWWSKNGPIDGEHKTYETDPDKILDILHKHNSEEDTPGALTADGKSRIAAAMPDLAAAAAAATETAKKFGTDDFLDTTGMKAAFDNLIKSIKDSIPTLEEVAPKEGETRDSNKSNGKVAGKAVKEKLDPIVTALGKVGGGGYGAGGMDMARENNRLTSKTNTLLVALHDTVKRGSGNLGGATFG